MPKSSLILVDRSIHIEQMRGISYDHREDKIVYQLGKVENVNIKPYQFGFHISSENISTFLKFQNEKEVDLAELIFWTKHFKVEDRPVVSLGEIFYFPNTEIPERVICLTKRSDGKRYLEFFPKNTTWPGYCIFLTKE